MIGYTISSSAIFSSNKSFNPNSERYFSPLKYIVKRIKNDLIHNLTESFEGHAKKNKKELLGIIYGQTGGSENFALIRSKGDTALFGKNTKAMKAQWKVPDNRPLADFAPTIILKAKDFATEITIHNAREQAMGHEQQISQEHVTNNEAVRKTLLSRGIRPEGLPPAEDVKKVERRLTSAEKNAIENPDALEE